jgi:hypothetical protein
MGWGACERALKPHLSRKGLSGKAKAKTGIGKSDLPGLQGGLGKRGHGGTGNPLRKRKREAGNPPPTAGAPELYRVPRGADHQWEKDPPEQPSAGLGS